MMYASKIEIKTEPQVIKFVKQTKLPDGLLTLEMLAKYVSKGEQFGISEREDGMFSTKLIMTIYATRLETPKEVKERISRQMKYNENYEKHILKYPRK